MADQVQGLAPLDQVDEVELVAVVGGGVTEGDLAKGAGWVINLAVAEWAIRRSGPGAATRGRDRPAGLVLDATVRRPS